MLLRASHSALLTNIHLLLRIYCDNHTKLTKTLSEKNSEFVDFETGGIFPKPYGVKAFVV
jgi:hypothetical protein